MRVIVTVLSMLFVACVSPPSVDEVSQDEVCIDCDPGDGGGTPPQVEVLAAPLSWSEPTPSVAAYDPAGLTVDAANLEELVAQRVGAGSWQWVQGADFAPTDDHDASCSTGGAWIGCQFIWRWQNDIIEWTCWIHTARGSGYCEGEIGLQGPRRPSAWINGRCGAGRLRC